MILKNYSIKNNSDLGYVIYFNDKDNNYYFNFYKNILLKNYSNGSGSKSLYIFLEDISSCNYKTYNEDLKKFYDYLFHDIHDKNLEKEELIRRFDVLNSIG